MKASDHPSAGAEHLAPRPLRILHLEDDAKDRELVSACLLAHGFRFHVTHAKDRTEFEAALAQAPFDLVLSDYNLPSFDGSAALRLVRERLPDSAFIFVSGTIGEERAVEGMKLGATDYVLKAHLDRLGLVVQRAMRELTTRKERRRAEEALQQSEERYRAIVENEPECVKIVSIDGNLVDMNPAGLRMLEIESLADVSGRDVAGFVHPDDRPAFNALHHRVIQGETGQLQFRIIGRRGTERWMETHSVPLRGPSGRVTSILSVTRDITQRRQTIEALRASEERFRAVVENIHEVFWMSDVDKRQMLYVSPGYEKIWGRSCESLYASPRAWLESIHEQDRERVMKASLNQATPGLYDESYRIVRPDGTLRWVRDRAFPVPDGDGRVRRIVGIAEDITERKQFEEQLLRAQRMESIGTLAGGIAHDLNNLLSPIMMGVDLLKYGGIDAAHRPTVEMMGRSAQRGANLVQQVLSFARGIDGARVAVHMSHLIREIQEFVRSTFPKNIHFRPAVPADTWLVSGDPTQLHQVLLNLCVNARDAMPDGGAITVAVKNVDIDEPFAAALKTVPPGRYVRIDVADTGKGIPRELLERIFEPFFTSKEVGKGTGLGLSTALGIVRNHGGSISVDSELGRGSTFRVFLPAQADLVEWNAPEPVKEDIPRGRGEAILVVDDDPNVLAATLRTLETFGYRAVGAADGAEAVALYVLRRTEIALVVTDLMLPVMDGASLIKALQRIDSAVKLIATSGHREAAGTPGARHFLAKPFKAEALLELVRQVLDEDGGGVPD